MKKLNQATGLPIYKYDWEDRLTLGDKHLLDTLRNEHSGTLTVQLAKLLDEMTETAGGQIALEEKKR